MSIARKVHNIKFMNVHVRNYWKEVAEKLRDKAMTSCTQPQLPPVQNDLSIVRTAVLTLR